MQSCHYILSPAEVDSAAEGAAALLRIALDAVASCKLASQRRCGGAD